MDLETTLIDPFVGPTWDRMVLSHPQANFFHSVAWARVLAKSYGHTPLYLRFSQKGALRAIVPLMEVNSYFTGRRGVCLPFSDCCSPLLFDDCKASIVTAKLSALALERSWKHFEIRGETEQEGVVGKAVEYYGHTLDLRQSRTGLLASFSGPVRRAIRKAEESKLRVEVSRSRKSLVEFYQLHVRTRRRHGLPPQPFSFFRNIYDEVIRTGSGFVVRAVLESRSVAAAIFFQFGRTAIYKFGASERAAQKLRGNNLVMWEAIRFLAHGCCEILHLGRTSLTNVGLRRFKLGWGAVEELIRYRKWDTAAGKWVDGRDHVTGLHNAFFAKMPIAINRFSGALLYPHLD